jgi:hypothetical protein
VNDKLFDIVDLGLGFFWLVVLWFIAYLYKNSKEELPHFRYFLPNVAFHFLFAFGFAAVYVFYYGGGDTTAYWEGAVRLNKLFWYDPEKFFAELFSTPYESGQFQRFNPSTGYPPGWIYREPESWFISKITSFFTFFTFNSYLAITFIYAFLSSIASWKLFELVRSFRLLSDKRAAIGTLFIPTLAFWCSGISKDTVIVIALFLLLYELFGLFTPDRKIGFWGWFAIFVYGLILFHVRPFMLIALFPALFLAFGTGIVRKFSDNIVLLFAFRFLIILFALAGTAFYFQTKGSLGALEPESYLQEAAVIQQDFAQNKLYEGKRYDLGVTDYTTTGMLRAFPASVVAAFYRPFIWEASSVFLLLSALEGVILLVLTFGFIFKGGGLFVRINQIRKNEFLTFAILFALIFGFSVGFTAILFGVLVRFKAPILPFLAVVLLSGKRKSGAEYSSAEINDNPLKP